MRICIDSSVFIYGLRTRDPHFERLIALISSDVPLVIPRLVAQEVTRNLQTPEQARLFYRIFYGRDFARIIDEPTPRHLVEKYAQLGLREKGDAFIGAFAEWLQARYLISLNRHFLSELQTDAFEVLDVAEFVTRWESGMLTDE